MNIIYGVLIFGIIIFVHEFGHFIVAKANGIGVVEFSIGMGPKITSFMKNGTRYSLKWIPFGGSCMMLGDDHGIVDPDEEPLSADLVERSFNSKSVWARISVIVAGPFFNFLLALVCAVVIISIHGVDRPVIDSIMENYPAQEAGIMAGDQIYSINGKRVKTIRDVSMYIDKYYKNELSLVVLRDGKKVDVKLLPKEHTEDGVTRFLIGIQWKMARYEKVKPHQAIVYGVHEVNYWIKITFQSLGMFFTGDAGINDLAGPVGIVDIVDEVVEESKSDGGYYVFLNLLNLMMLLSANIGIMNLLPIPAVDGGRLFFLLIEAVRGKPVDRKKEGYVHMIGIILLFILMIVVMFNDLFRAFGK